MTDSTLAETTGSTVRLENQGAVPSSGIGATAALLICLFASQNSGSMLTLQAAEAAAQYAVEVRSVEREDIFEELLDFHNRLIASQRELPEDAARILRDNLWQMYE
jgi:hypothetical protein